MKRIGGVVILLLVGYEVLAWFLDLLGLVHLPGFFSWLP